MRRRDIPLAEPELADAASRYRGLERRHFIGPGKRHEVIARDEMHLTLGQDAAVFPGNPSRDPAAGLAGARRLADAR